MSWFSRTLAVVCALGAGGFAPGVSPALGAFPGQNGKIVFDSDRDGGDYDVWSMTPRGATSSISPPVPRRLTNARAGGPTAERSCS